MLSRPLLLGLAGTIVIASCNFAALVPKTDTVVAGSPDAPAKPAIPTGRRLPTPPPPPAGSGSAAGPPRPPELYPGDCLGNAVYVTSRDYRECCVLCSVGDDSESEQERKDWSAVRAAEKEANSPTTIVNVDGRTFVSNRFTAFRAVKDEEEGDGKKGEAGKDAASAPGGAASKGAGATGSTGSSSAQRSSTARGSRQRNAYGGFSGLSSRF